MADKKISQLTAATLPLAGTEVLPIVQGGVTTKVATDDLTVKNFRSNASTGLLQVAGPGAGTTRVMTTPNANFTAARTDAAQTFSGNQTLSNNLLVPSGVVVVGETTAGMYIDVMNGTVDAQRVRVTTTGTDGLIVATRSGGTTPNLIFRIDASEFFRIGSSGNLTATNGNLVIGTAGKGIDFSANTALPGATSELLNYYETGTWTPNQGSGLTVVGAFSSTGLYTRVGNQVTITGSLSGATSISIVSPGIIFTNSPYAVAGPACGSMNSSSLTSSGAITAVSGTTVYGNTSPAVSTIYFAMTYIV